MNLPSKKVIDDIIEKIAGVLCYCVVGFVVLEVFFNKGLFSGGLINLYQFIMYLVWAVVLSVPVMIFCPNKVEMFNDYLFPKLDKDLKLKMNKEAMEEMIDDKDNEMVEEVLELYYHLIQALIIVITMKLLGYFEIANVEFLGVKPIYLKLVISYFATIILSYPIGTILSKLYYMKAKRYFKKILN